MEQSAFKIRVGTVRKLLRKRRLNALVVTKPANVTYLTGFAGDDSWAVVTARSVYLLTDSRYIDQAQDQCANCKIIQRVGSLAEAAAGILNRAVSVRGIAVENNISLAAFQALRQNLAVRPRVIANLIESIRQVKDDSEVTSVKKAAKIAAEVLKKTLSQLQRGMSENELAGLLELEVRRHGAGSSFDTIVAFGANASRPHHRCSNRKLKRNDTVLIDFGVRYNNYCCDLTRCFVVGGTSAQYRKALNVVRQAQETAISTVKPGAEIKHIDTVCRQVIRDSGLAVYGHGTGHGLGLEVHEEPVISRRSKGKLEAGMIFTIEPGVYVPGKFGVRIEDDILVTNSGCEILTKDCPQEISLGR